MTYNLTGIGDNTTGIVPFIQVVNDNLMFGYFGILILIMTFAISLITFIMSTNEAGKSIVAASFGTFTVAVLLRGLNLIPDLAIFVTLIMLAASLAFNLREN